jgi:hypothetical protein
MFVVYTFLLQWKFKSPEMLRHVAGRTVMDIMKCLTLLHKIKSTALGLLDSADGSNTVLQNIVNCLSSLTAETPKIT